MHTDKGACERASKPFREVKPGQKFHFMGEWHLATERDGIMAGLRLNDQEHPCRSDASPGTVVLPSSGCIVTVLH